jgi:glutaredoxin
MAEITIYTTPTCPKCNKLKAFMQDKSIPFNTSDMSTPEALTELRFNGVFTITAPVLQVGDRFFESGEIFKGGEVNGEIFQ